MSSGREIVVVLIIVVVYTIQLSNCDEEMKCDYLSPKENCTYLINYAEFLSGQDDGQKDFCSGYFIKRALDLCERFNLNWEACTVSMRKECHPVSGANKAKLLWLECENDECKDELKMLECYHNCDQRYAFKINNSLQIKANRFFSLLALISLHKCVS
ncbi:uncharacterized protein LOC142344147 isoform X2 [Convolutriloba macropyga]|uniref:uncharacterized protein LOC142344147 isoform X2 n=1 Tax=Convolutriloba macropyga TaxID=536237 RepID=UPI003F51EAF9